MERVETAHLFSELHGELLRLLESLSPQDWTRPTVCAGWTVKDVAAHILDTQLRLVSMGRDGFRPEGRKIQGYRDLVDFLNELNAQWVKAFRRVSPQVLVAMLRDSGEQLTEYVTQLDPDGPALFPVAWAGEEVSQQWFDTGRNYTEYWHHQQQIREAVGAEGLVGVRWLGPVIALFVRAIPLAYQGQAGGRLTVEITGEAGGVWVFDVGSAEARVRLSDDTAWRLFTKGISRDLARSRVEVFGDAEMGERFLGVLAVMA